MRVLDLFSGIGGISIGLDRAGMETVAFCEIDDFCQEVLSKSWPGIPIYDDVKELSYVGEIELICGGYPCQPFSVAGPQKAENDPRHLWPSMLNQIERHKPTWVIGENVKGHINRGLDRVLADLEEIGYAARTFCLSAKAFGANHNRERIWIVAHASSDGCYESAESGSDEAANGDGAQGAQKDCNHEGCGSLRVELEGSGYSPWSWGAQPPEIRVDDGLSDRSHRNKALGNAVIPQIPQIIGNTIMKVEAIHEKG